MAKENIISAVINEQTTPHISCDFVPLTKRESIGKMTDKENAQDAREIS